MINGTVDRFSTIERKRGAGHGEFPVNFFFFFSYFSINFIINSSLPFTTVLSTLGYEDSYIHTHNLPKREIEMTL